MIEDEDCADLAKDLVKDLDEDLTEDRAKDLANAKENHAADSPIF